MNVRSNDGELERGQRVNKYAILANPASGALTVQQKLAVLSQPSRILNAPVFGLDTASKSELVQCAQKLAESVDVIAVAGGDGTMSDIFNAVDTGRISSAFLPLGSGNALKYALGYGKNISDIAVRIRNAAVCSYDLINCSHRQRAFMASAGIEGAVIRLRDHYRMQGVSGFAAYRKAVLACVRKYRRTDAQIIIDGKRFEIKNLLGFRIVKQPFYGYGIRVMPQAKFDDGLLHIGWISSEIWKSAAEAVAATVFGFQPQPYLTGRHVAVKLEYPVPLQADGNEAWVSDEFEFEILPGALKIKV